MRNRAAEKGMTLIEILIALIVMVLGVLGILALFPPALQSGTESMEETNAAILAESVSHALMSGFASVEEDKTSTTGLKLKVTLTHDLKSSSANGRYTFVLPPLPTDPTTNEEWWHYPSTASPPNQGGSTPPGDSGSKMTGAAWDPEQDDRHFQLGGDQWLVNTVDDVHAVNDPTDPLKQFGFSFDIRKVDNMYHQRKDPAAVDPYRNTILKIDDYEAMEKLYELRIHILRISQQGASGGAQGAVFRRYITSFTKRISVK